MVDASLSEQQIAEYREAFSFFDKDGDNATSRRELGDVMRALGQNSTHAEVQQLVAESDADGNGVIDFNKFCNMMVKHSQKLDDRAELQEAFRVFHKDGDGQISASELRGAIAGLGEQLSAQQAREVISRADTDGDGAISYHGFVKMLYGEGAG